MYEDDAKNFCPVFIVKRRENEEQNGDLVCETYIHEEIGDMRDLNFLGGLML